MILKSHPRALPDVISLLTEKGLRNCPTEGMLSIENVDSPSGCKTVVINGDLTDAFTAARSWPPSFLLDILAELETISLSKHSMRAIMSKGQRVPPKPIMHEILAFMAGVHEDWCACGDLLTVSNLTAFLSEECQKRGRRGRELRLPPDWASMGIYQKRTFQNHGLNYLEVKHRFTHETAHFDAKLWCGSDIENIGISKNYSELLAELDDSNRPGWSLKLAPLFVCQYVEPWRSELGSLQPVNSERQQLALGDGLASDITTAGSTPAMVVVSLQSLSTSSPGRASPPLCASAASGSALSSSSAASGSGCRGKASAALVLRTPEVKRQKKSSDAGLVVPPPPPDVQGDGGAAEVAASDLDDRHAVVADAVHLDDGHGVADAVDNQDLADEDLAAAFDEDEEEKAE